MLLEKQPDYWAQGTIRTEACTSRARLNADARNSTPSTKPDHGTNHISAMSLFSRTDISPIPGFQRKDGFCVGAGVDSCGGDARESQSVDEEGGGEARRRPISPAFPQGRSCLGKDRGEPQAYNYRGCGRVVVALL